MRLIPHRGAFAAERFEICAEIVLERQVLVADQIRLAVLAVFQCALHRFAASESLLRADRSILIWNACSPNVRSFSSYAIIDPWIRRSCEQGVQGA